MVGYISIPPFQKWVFNKTDKIKRYQSTYQLENYSHNFDLEHEFSEENSEIYVSS